ncbi:hypothetical protein GCM10010885_21810 [Alicyclobacillus cellulosilyticus]|uniref:YqeG family HAD IIIA-type phosphatase n=1 Tax=Alicyclobacillus cellulosilyticus TaxID=1003997 RepID=A0A917KG74_9BACL|nr:hypothetical protein GCM10010885_21810 [Alicyclobacillus cellulosilyticus]
MYDIHLDKLWRQGKRVILTDLDNTLVPWNDRAVPQKLQAWLQAVQARGFRVLILSNNHDERVQAFSLDCGIPAIAKARKPRPWAFRQALAMLGATPEESVMVGDQLFTDVRGAKRAGIYAILVQPVDPREWWGTRLLRLAERWAMRRLARRGVRFPAAAAARPQPHQAQARTDPKRR